ncbi:MAG: twin-arginine translocase subunit TatB [Rhizobiales bacterium]|nr:twin-arginine translocase subunit TatB [Hyphomicrobiales bacterium]
MFDIDASKLLIIGVFALIFLGPKELPRVMRQVGNAVGKLRRMASDFQGQFMDAMREAELDDIRKEVTKISDSAKVDLPSLDPSAEIRKAIETGGQPADPNATPPGAAPLDLAPPALAEVPPATSETIADAIRAETARADTLGAPVEEVTFRQPPPEPAPARAEPAQDVGSDAAPRRRSARPTGA